MNNIPILILCVFFACTDGFAQTPTPITTENYDSAIEACLCIDPVNGLCSESGYGAMPDWDMRNVTNLAEAFLNRTEFNGNISSWDVSNVKYMWALFLRATKFNQSLESWNVTSVENRTNIFSNSALDISALEHGIYVLKLFDGFSVLSDKFIKY